MMRSRAQAEDSRGGRAEQAGCRHCKMQSAVAKKNGWLCALQHVAVRQIQAAATYLTAVVHRLRAQRRLQMETGLLSCWLQAAFARCAIVNCACRHHASGCCQTSARRFH